MSLSAWVHSRGEIEWPKLFDDASHVVVKVKTYDNRSIGVLWDDASSDFNHPFSSLFQVRFFTELKIEVENLNVLVAELELSPTKISPKCLH